MRLFGAENGSHPGGRSLLRPLVAIALASVACVGAWLLAARGISTDYFPTKVPGAAVTPIARYSGPWLTAAAGAALVAALLVLAAGVDLVRWSRRRGALIAG